MGGDIRTSDTKMTVVAMMLQPGEWEEVARVLVEAGADMEFADEDDVPPLFIAAEQGHLEVVKCLADAGADFGFERRVTGTHNLRVAGATAAYHATGGKKEVVQRLGRWASDAFQGYVWEDRSLTAGLSSAMLRAPWAPHMAAF